MGILRPEEFSIQSATKRLDIFEEDRKRIMRSPWLREDDDHKQQLVSKPGVYDFFDDWSDDIRKDLDQLSMAVDQVLGIAPPPPVTTVVEEPINNQTDNVGFIKIEQNQIENQQPPQPPQPLNEPKVKEEVKIEIK